MNKNTLIAFFFLVSTLCGYSQIFWNVKAGMNLSTITPMEMNEKKTGYQFGVGMDYFFHNHWGIQPSLMLVSKGYKNKVEDYDYPSEFDFPFYNWKSYYYTANRIYISMPVMLAYRFNLSGTMKLVFNGGGYISYGIAGKYKGEQTLKDGSIEKIDSGSFSAGTKRLDTGFGAGATLEYKNKYMLNLFGELGLKNVSGSTKNRSLGLNVGYKF
jgi:hypothetical protein